MKRLLLSLASAACLSVNAGIMIDITPLETTVKQGETFSLQIDVVTSEEILHGGTFKLGVDTAGSGLFSIAGRADTGAPFTEKQKSNGEIIGTFLSPTSEVLGGGVPDYGTPSATPVGPGRMFMSTIELQAETTAALGTYTFSIMSPQFIQELEVLGAFPVDPSSIVLDNVDIEVTSSSAAVPEPSAFALFGLCGLMMMRRRR